MTRISLTNAQCTAAWADRYQIGLESLPLGDWGIFNLGFRNAAEEGVSPIQALTPPAEFEDDKHTIMGHAFAAGQLALLQESPLHMRAYLGGFDQGCRQRMTPPGGSLMWPQACQTCGVRYASMCTATASGYDYTCVSCGAIGRQRLLANPTGQVVMRLAAQGAFGADAPDNPGYGWLVDHVLVAKGWNRNWLERTMPTQDAIPLLPELAFQCWRVQRRPDGVVPTTISWA